MLFHKLLLFYFFHQIQKWSSNISMLDDAFYVSVGKPATFCTKPGAFVSVTCIFESFIWQV